jgi:hypothetical protein
MDDADPLLIMQAFMAHRESIRGVSLAPNDLKFVTGSDDSTLKVRARLCALSQSTDAGCFPFLVFHQVNPVPLGFLLSYILSMEC